MRVLRPKSQIEIDGDKSRVWYFVEFLEKDLTSRHIFMQKSRRNVWNIHASIRRM